MMVTLLLLLLSWLSLQLLSCNVVTAAFIPKPLAAIRRCDRHHHHLGWIPLETSSSTASSSSASSWLLLQAKRNNKNDNENNNDNNNESDKSQKATSNRRRGRRSPSRVIDEDGPTDAIPYEEPTMIQVEDIPELKYDEAKRPVPHQPWRRGETDGCEDPITALWRQEAHDIIVKAALMVGANVLDVTWYLTQVVITLDDDLEGVERYESGPEIDIQEPADVLYYDPNDPNPEPIWVDDDNMSTVDENGKDENIVYQRDVDAERQFKRNMYARKNVEENATDEDDDDDDLDIPSQNEDDDEDVPLYMTEETRQDVALRTTVELEQRLEQEEQPVDIDALKIDTAALSTIAQAILDALETVEDQLQILARHEIILTSPGASDVLETQRQFDAFRGFDVIVETQDPFQSNRILKGKLLERNSMDLIINKKGRMVTIPLNFVKCVRLPPAKREKGVPQDVPF